MPYAPPLVLSQICFPKNFRPNLLIFNILRNPSAENSSIFLKDRKIKKNHPVMDSKQTV